MGYPSNLLDEIRARLSVSQVVGRRVALKKKGREYAGLSPFKKEKTASFLVNDQKGFYHCFASGEHGDIFKFLMTTEGMSFEDAVKDLAKKAGVELPHLQPTRRQELLIVPRANDAGQTPQKWRYSSDLRLFISHVSQHNDKATRLKNCLASYGISGFVAHDDIKPTLDWQSEIERALKTMDAFLAIHTVGFSKSIWTQQEIGFALGRGVKVISFRMGEDPTGFISKHQALARRGRTAEQIAEEVNDILADDPKTSVRLAAAKSARGLTDEIPF